MKRVFVVGLFVLAACSATGERSNEEGQVIRKTTTPKIDPACEGCAWQEGDEATKAEGACKKGPDACEARCCIK